MMQALSRWTRRYVDLSDLSLHLIGYLTPHRASILNRLACHTCVSDHLPERCCLSSN